MSDVIIPHVFSDNDGVLADFEGGFEQQFGMSFYDCKPSLAWSLIYKNPEFYFKLPMMENAELYWAAILPYSPTILTGCPTAGSAAAADAKRRWIAKYLGADVPVITCRSADKQLHMKNPGDILIDDHQKNLTKWTDAGGTSILFVNHDQAVQDFKSLME